MLCPQAECDMSFDTGETFQRRYCALSGSTLLIYKDDKSTTPEEVVCLQVC